MSVKQRIEQNGEKLFTVRPRYQILDDKRGTSSSIRFKIPDEAKWNDYLESAQASKKLSASTVNALRNSLDTSDNSLGFVNFIAESVSYSIQEKSQIMHTFGSNEAVYFYGQAPVIVNVTGMVIDDLDNDQFAQFLNLYRNFLRGSEAAKDYGYVELNLNNAQFTGAFLSVNVSQGSERDQDVQFQASFIAREFYLRSTDDIFKTDSSDDIESYSLGTRPPDPTLAKAIIQNTIEANEVARLMAVRDDPLSEADEGATLNTGNEAAWQIGTLPRLSDALSAADITSFFGKINSVINNVTKPIQDIANQISNFAQDVISIIESVENGIDSIQSNIDSATRAVYGAKADIEDMVGQVNNFPENMAAKLGRLGSRVTPPSIAGSGRAGQPGAISPSSAMATLSLGKPTGAARGTPAGEAASLSVSSSASLGASLSVSSGSNEPEPTLVIASGEEEATPTIQIGG